MKLAELITCLKSCRRRRPSAPIAKPRAGGVGGSYPRNGHDAQSEQAGSQQVPQAVTVQLQSHGQGHGPQQIQHLHRRRGSMRTSSEQRENTVGRRGNAEESRHLQLLLSYFLWLCGLRARVSPCILGVAGTLAESWPLRRSEVEQAKRRK